MIRSRRHPASTLLLLTLLLAIVAAASLYLGVTPISIPQVATTLFGHGEQVSNLVVLDLRLPRLALGLLIGAGVAVSGVVLQGLTQNDLAGPDTVGVNAGSGLGMMFLLASYMYPAAKPQPWLLPVVAVAGAVVVTALVFVLAYRKGSVLPSRLLLVGVAVSLGAHAMTLFFSLRVNLTMYNYMVSWMTGTLAGGDWKSVWLLLPCCLVIVPIIFSRARVLNVFSLGDNVAASVGVAVERQRLLLLCAATMLTAVCVAIGGHIGFLGLASPHLARRLVGINHFVLLPTAALCGAILLVAADSLGRQIFAPIEVPAGVLVGIIGGTYFLYLLSTTRE